MLQVTHALALVLVFSAAAAAQDAKAVGEVEYANDEKNTESGWQDPGLKKRVAADAAPIGDETHPDGRAPIGADAQGSALRTAHRHN
jgi:hypothetical protein